MIVLETILWLAGIGLAVFVGLKIRIWLNDRHILNGNLPEQRRI